MEQNIVVVDASRLEDIVKKAVSDAFTNHGKVENNQPFNEPYASRKQAAEYLGISLPTLSRKTKDALFPSYRIGRKIVYRLSEIGDSITKRKFSV